MLIAFLLTSTLLFVIGAILGSFLNVVIYRTLDDDPVKRHESWMSGWSRCDSCHHRIAWYDNIPLVSYVVLQAKCRNCHKPIGAAHPMVELLTGSLLVWWYWGGSLFFQITKAPFHTLQPLFWLSVGVLLLVIALADLRYWIIPDWAVVMLTGLTVLYRVVLVGAGVMQYPDLVATLIASVLATAGLGVLWLATKRQGIGLGDVKLMFPLGLLVGWPNVLVTLFLGFVLGAVVGIALVLRKTKNIHQAIPFGPFLVLASCVSLVWGDRIVSWYLQLLR